MSTIKVHKASDGKIRQIVEIGAHTLYADEPPANGGDDMGPTPHELLDAALATCTALTVTLVARRKQFPLQDVRVEIDHERTDDGVHHMHRRIELVGALSDEQKQYLLGIANKCPVHRTLTGRIEIDTKLAG